MNCETLITTLCRSRSAGHIKETVNVAADYLKSFAEVEVNENYIKAVIDKNSDRTIMLEAHIDQVGFIVTAVFDDGFLKVAPVGSIDPRFLPSTEVVLFGKEKVSGVFTSVPPHLKKGDALPNFDVCLVDTGRADIKDVVSPGDIGFFASEPTSLLNNCITACGLDNRAGCAAVLLAAEKIASEKSGANVIILLTMGEELGLRGAKVAAFDSKADIALAVDVSFGNFEGISSDKTSTVGSGPMIGISPILSKNIYSTLTKLAENCNIPYTKEVMGGRTGTNADIISISGSGIPAALVSIPLRNMHTPCEVVSLADIENSAQLIYLFVKEGFKC
jgi:endoglucanase